jgi:hypothetical protein
MTFFTIQNKTKFVFSKTKFRAIGTSILQRMGLLEEGQEGVKPWLRLLVPFESLNYDPHQVLVKRHSRVL